MKTISRKVMSTALGTPTRIVAEALLVLFIVLAIIAPPIWGDQARLISTDAIGQAPSGAHLLGTDLLGRDVLARALVATRTSVLMAVGATVGGAVLGLILGALPSVLGTRIQRGFATVLSIWMGFPSLLLALFATILLGPSAKTAMLALMLTLAPAFGRLMQTLATSIQSSDYLAAARMLGVPRRRQLTRYIVPNIAEPLTVYATLQVGNSLLALSAMSFLGLSVQPPGFDWGRMLGDALPTIYIAPWVAVAPGCAIVLAGLAFGFSGEAVASATRDRSSGLLDSRTVGRLGAPPEPEPAVAGQEDASQRPADGRASRRILTVDGLTASFPTEYGWHTPVRDVSFSLDQGEMVGIVGESGSGKSVTTLAVARVLGDLARVGAREVTFEGKPILDIPERNLSQEIGTDIGVVFQDSQNALNPAIRVGKQLSEILENRGVPARRARELAVEALRRVHLPEPEAQVDRFPDQLSGGMRQRVLIAMATIGRPRLLIADEPTTALDVTVQRHILTLMRQYCAESEAAALVVSHDIAVLGTLCSRVLVMYGGRIVEDVPASDLSHPERLRHPYTKALVGALPDLTVDTSQPLATIPENPPESWLTPVPSSGARTPERSPR